MVTFACVWVRGNVPYTDTFVRALRAGVRRYYPHEHRFVCLTDTTLEGIECIGIRANKNIPGWWSKIELFNRKHDLKGRVVYLDLDTLIVDDLTPIVEYDAPFALVPPGGTFQGRGKLKVVTRYNSSVMSFDVSDRLHRLYDLWHPEAAGRLWGDQDYIGQMLPNEATMPAEWFPRLSEVCDIARANGLDPETASGSNMSNIMPDARVVLSKKPKNDVAARQMKWFREAWL